MCGGRCAKMGFFYLIGTRYDFYCSVQILEVNILGYHRHSSQPVLLLCKRLLKPAMRYKYLFFAYLCRLYQKALACRHGRTTAQSGVCKHIG